MKVIVNPRYRSTVSRGVPVSVPLKVLVKEIDDEDHTWYLIECDFDSKSIINTDDDSNFKRPYVAPGYLGLRRHRCCWVSSSYCEEIDILSNRDAISLLRRD